MSCPDDFFISDPDISGIGVRLAIYIQNLLSFIPAIWALWDGHVTEYELESVETQSTTILLTRHPLPNLRHILSLIARDKPILLLEWDLQDTSII